MMAAALTVGGTAGAAAADLAAPKVMPAPVAVAASTPIDFIFGARLASDYIFRGISQSNRRPSVQSYGEVQLFDNFFYAGFATYRVDLPTKPQQEVDLTIGIRPKFGQFTFDFGLIYYYYPGERRFLNPYSPVTYDTFFFGTFDGPGILTPRNTDFLEFAGKVTWTPSDQWTIGGGVFHAYDWLGTGAPATYINGTAKYALPEGLVGPGVLAFSGEIGYYDLGKTSPQLGSIKLADYTTWNIGASYTYKQVTLDLRYHDTNLGKRDCFLNTTDPRGVFNGGRSNWCSETFVATLSVDLVASQLGIFAPAK
jgi:hypothetical protein